MNIKIIKIKDSNVCKFELFRFDLYLTRKI